MTYLKATKQVAKTEKDAQNKLKLYDPYEFHVVNPSKKTRVGSSSFDQKPVKFFERNPILQVPSNVENDLPVCKAAASAFDQVL
ncbi:hypothetical protein RJ641_001107 [Dillenia turbinata]|uniref:Uncharacterized protein n=1 Tax=Dillenia turbinata TaxID=194707 RepID=A0AAN8W7K9_9MAGN